MTTATASWPRDLMTLADWKALPEDELHDVECSEGVLIVVPKPSPRHQFVAGELSAARTG